MYCLSVTISEESRETVSAVGYVCGMSGCVEETIGDDTVLTFYFEREDDAKSAAAAFAELLPSPIPPVDFIEDKQDWNAKWRESMEPAEIASGVWVSPIWLEPPADGRTAWIKIEPKMAFGTGHHETTRLAAQEIMAQKDFIAGKTLLDIGTGSGVLCFVADLAGARRAIGIEIDSDCRENLAENLRDNPPRGRVDFIIGTSDALNDNITRDNNDGKLIDAAVMNMLITESEPLLGRIAAMVNDDSILIWSGILQSEKNDAVTAAGRHGFKVLHERSENEWWCGTFIRR